MRESGYPEEKIQQIKHCIVAHRFRSGIEPRTKEAKVLSDADKLDVLGATGIARSFTIGGECGQKIWSDTSIEQYIQLAYLRMTWTRPTEFPKLGLLDPKQDLTLITKN